MHLMLMAVGAYRLLNAVEWRDVWARAGKARPRTGYE